MSDRLKNVKFYGNIKVKWEIRKGVLKVRRTDGGAALIQTQLFTLNKKDVIRVLENNLLNSQMSASTHPIHSLRLQITKTTDKSFYLYIYLSKLMYNIKSF